MICRDEDTATPHTSRYSAHTARTMPHTARVGTRRTESVISPATALQFRYARTLRAGRESTTSVPATTRNREFTRLRNVEALAMYDACPKAQEDSVKPDMGRAPISAPTAPNSNLNPAPSGSEPPHEAWRKAPPSPIHVVEFAVQVLELVLAATRGDAAPSAACSATLRPHAVDQSSIVTERRARPRVSSAAGRKMTLM